MILNRLPVLCGGRLAVGRVQLVLRARRVRRGRVVLGRHRAARRRGEPHGVVRLLLRVIIASYYCKKDLILT